MEPTPSQVSNQYSQKDQEAHLERALAFEKVFISQEMFGFQLSAFLHHIADD